MRSAQSAVHSAAASPRPVQAALSVPGRGNPGWQPRHAMTRTQQVSDRLQSCGTDAGPEQVLGHLQMQGTCFPGHGWGQLLTPLRSLSNTEMCSGAGAGLCSTALQRFRGLRCAVLHPSGGGCAYKHGRSAQ